MSMYPAKSFLNCSETISFLVLFGQTEAMLTEHHPFFHLFRKGSP